MKLHITYDFDPRYIPSYFAIASFEPDGAPVFAAAESFPEARKRLIEKYKWHLQKKRIDVPTPEDVEIEEEEVRR